MNIIRTILAVAVILLTATPPAKAESPEKRKTTSLLLGIGHTNILDTYLSPEKYNGINLTLVSHTMRENASSWARTIHHEGNIAFADNRSGNGGEMAGSYTFRYAMLHKWRLGIGRRTLRVMAGGAVNTNLGFVYNTRNGNNPANARFSLDIGPAVAFDLPLGAPGHFRGVSISPGDCAHYPAVIRYEASAPLAGLMFSPNYGQTYYEIFTQGNYDHNVVPTTIGSTPSFRQMLTVDFRLARTTWRIGYLGTIEQAHVNNLKQHTYTHSLVIGFVKKFNWKPIR